MQVSRNNLLFVLLFAGGIVLPTQEYPERNLPVAKEL